MAVIGQRNNFRLGFWAFTLMEESSEPCATLSRKIPDFSNWKSHDAFESAFARLKKDLEAENSNK
jgi:hypothetical protein